MYRVKFFFYGTLMEYVHPHAMVETKSEHASALGTVFDLGPFPGATFPDITGNPQYGDIVYGKMTTFIAPNMKVIHQILNQFDGYEGYNPKDLEHSLYIRKVVDVLTMEGEKHKCWTYQFNKFDQNSGVYVPGGNWAKFKAHPFMKYGAKEATSDEEDIS
jgi:gamma-glutamylcyclotransferase (GGCT)/AIG2-like uncharacterized protein YtfP